MNENPSYGDRPGIGSHVKKRARSIDHLIAESIARPIAPEDNAILRGHGTLGPSTEQIEAKLRAIDPALQYTPIHKGPPPNPSYLPTFAELDSTRDWRFTAGVVLALVMSTIAIILAIIAL